MQATAERRETDHARHTPGVVLDGHTGTARTLPAGGANAAAPAASRRETAWLHAVRAGCRHDPATTADLVAMVAAHGLRRLPDHSGLQRALLHARRRRARYDSAGAARLLWLRFSDRRFVRRAALRYLREVVDAVTTRCGDAEEVRLVGLLQEVLTTRRAVDRDAPCAPAASAIVIRHPGHAVSR